VGTEGAWWCEGCRPTHKAEFGIKRNFAHKPEADEGAEGHTIPVRFVIMRNFTRKPEFGIRTLLGAQLRWWDLAAMNLAAMNLAAMNLAAMNEMNKP